MPIKILLVDDEPDMHRLIRMRFRGKIRDNSYSFLYAFNGVEAIEIIKGNPDIQAILCDIKMPQMSGLEFLHQLQLIHPEIKVIMVTAYGNMENIRSAMNGGAFDFVNKPIVFEDLQKTLEKALEAFGRLKDAVDERDHLQELDQLKSHFFTQISHEFRTPLTVITGMADQIMEAPNQWSLKGGELIKRNAKGMLRLVKQILDLRKLEAGKLQMEMVKGDVIAYLRYIFESFQTLAESKDLDISFETNSEEMNMDYDPDKLLSIVSNLLSNAIKYTPAGGRVKLSMSLTPDRVQNSVSVKALEIEISDSGIGIPAENLDKIFTRFYQVDHTVKQGGEGTGIGLTLTYELIKLLEGEITVLSETGKGTSFKVTLPIQNNALRRDDNRNWQIPKGEVTGDEMPEPEISISLADLPRLLIVEDNPDIVQYLSSLLSESYQLLIANDGEVGITKAIEEVPDIIISDVMMPRKDGYELCESLKQHELTSHIPIILLTAKADVESRLTGLGLGADAYLAKPFERKELQIRLEQLIEGRKKLQARYRQPDLTDNPIHQKQDHFLQKCKDIILQHLDDSQFRSPDLTTELGMSRSQVHRKLKALTDLSASLFIQDIRLQKADEMMLETDLNISEIAYLTGHSSPDYFSKLYKKKYGSSPRARRNAGE